MLTDIRYALRQLARSPGFAAAAIVTLALGMGANTAVFSLADTMLFRALPYPEAERLVMVWEQLMNIGVRQMPVSARTFDAYRANYRVFEAAAIFQEEDHNLIGATGAERVSVLSSTPGLFDLLGAHTAIGRGFTQDDWQPGHANVVILSHSLFARRFGGDRGILGTTVRLDDRACTVLGVLAPDFEFSLRSERVDVWTPLPPVADRGRSQFRMLARMRPGIGLKAAQASVTPAAKHVEETLHPYQGPNGEDADYRAIVISLHDQLFGDFRAGTLILLSAVAMLLLIACVNVANLLLARAAAREREVAVRRALGASGLRLVRQWMAEAGVLAMLGGAAGLLVSLWGVSALRGLRAAKSPAWARIGLDERALLFTFAISCVVCLLFGLAPSCAVLRMNLTLRGPRPKRRISSVLVATEVALALVLLVGASLLLKSLVRLRQVDPGFRPDHLLSMRVQLPGPRYNQARHRIEFFSQMKRRLEALPGVVSATMVSRLPVALPVGSLDGRSGNPFSIEGRPWDPNSGTRQIAHTQTVGLDYFRTMGIPLRAGRDFSDADTLNAPLVAVINDTLARQWFPHGDAIGRQLLLGAPEPGARWMTIAGIVAAVKTGSLDQPSMPQFYMPQTQDAPSSMTMVLRTVGDPAKMTRQASEVVRGLDSDAPVYDVATVEQRIADSIGQPRYQSLVLAFFAAAALFLAVVGIYGVVTHATIQRTREIGIRMALGADPARVIAMVLARGLRPVAVGIALGLGGAAILARLLASILFQTPPLDPATFAWAVAVLGAAAIAACLIPARRATLLDPVAALREE